MKKFVLLIIFVCAANHTYAVDTKCLLVITDSNPRTKDLKRLTLHETDGDRRLAAITLGGKKTKLRLSCDAIANKSIYARIHSKRTCDYNPGNMVGVVEHFTIGLTYPDNFTSPDCGGEDLDTGDSEVTEQQ